MALTEVQQNNLVISDAIKYCVKNAVLKITYWPALLTTMQRGFMTWLLSLAWQNVQESKMAQL